ncbi:MAG: xanthine phosphoribosyltransferase [Spirochaetaceae bacterium]|jgi:xanthine phosphoribosyltransferase|nr:xanthine phosphoribosyltransferase [Spirochaetaceae bacterium]
MKLLKDLILAEGKVMPGNILNVGSFLNQQLDIGLFNEMGKEFARRFAGQKVTRILTVEASGIGVACITAQYFNNVPVVFARKHHAKNIGGDVYHVGVTSYTQGTDYNITVSKEHLRPEDSVLLIDDFLAKGCAIEGLASLIKVAGAALTGVGIVIEKGFQSGGKRLRDQNIHLESLAIIESMSPEGICFRA